MVLCDISTGESWWGIWNLKKEQDDFLDVLSVYNPAELVCGVSDDFYRQLTSFCSSRLGSCLVTRMPETDETCKGTWQSRNRLRMKMYAWPLDTWRITCRMS